MQRYTVSLLIVLGACQPHDHGHGHGHAQEEAEEPEPLAITRWTDRYELFVELPAPTPGAPIPYHAHVTRLSDFGAVTEGTFRVRFKTASGVAAEATQNGVKRPGIFVFESVAPPAGVYTLEMSYESDVFDCGSITVSDPPTAGPEAAGSTITFLKESQWKIPFRTAWAEPQPMAKEMEIAATVEPASVDQLTLGAPTAGRFFHNPKLALAEGLRVKKGDVIGTIAPTAAGDDFSRLELAVEESSLAKAQIQRELDRIGPLVAQGLLPERRRVELQNELETHTARLRSAGGRLGGVVSPGGGAGITVRSTLDGLVSQVLVPNGAPVDAGAPLVRIGGTDHMWIRARFVAKPPAALALAAPTAARLPSGERVELDNARFLSALPVVDAASRIATWIVDVGRSALLPGSNVVLLIRIGAPETLLAVPREAVIEINTRPYVFVQVDGEHFEKRPVMLGHVDGPWIHVKHGIEKGERIVSLGGFDIHLASLMGSVESHRH